VGGAVSIISINESMKNEHPGHLAMMALLKFEAVCDSIKRSSIDKTNTVHTEHIGISTKGLFPN
jgi:hypothetical protein